VCGIQTRSQSGVFAVSVKYRGCSVTAISLSHSLSAHRSGALEAHKDDARHTRQHQVQVLSIDNSYFLAADSQHGFSIDQLMIV